jgi:serine/threonine-protein phosphatase 2A regulatory subunit A
LIASEDDEVLFAIAEEIGAVFDLLADKTVFLPLLEELSRSDETVVREQASKSLTIIVNKLQDTDVQNTFCPIVIKLAQSEWFTGRVSSCALFEPCYKRAGQ